MNALTEHPRGRPSSSLHFVVGEMNGKLDQLMASLLPQLQSLREADASLEARVIALERGKWLVVGGGSIVVFLIGAWEIVRYVIHL